MTGDLKKFVNPKFLKTIDLDLLKRLFERRIEQRIARQSSNRRFCNRSNELVP